MTLVRLGGVALGMALLAACASEPTLTACSPTEQIGDAGGIHVLPGAEVTYDLSPPTSGPHQLPAPVPGVVDEPVAEPVQVSGLEAGLVILQYAPSVADDDRLALEALAAEPDVLVAPAVRTLDDDAVMAFTSWGVRQLCRVPDADTAAAFVATHRGRSGSSHSG